jgi:hypothetical protein
MIAYLRDLLGIQTDVQKAAAGRRSAISELAAGKDPDDLLDQVGSGLMFDGPNPFDNEAREAILECGELFAYTRKGKSHAS